MGIGKQIGNSLLANIGIIEKAIIEIEDNRGIETTRQEAVKISKGQIANTTLRNDVSPTGISSYIRVPKQSKKRYTVQFNPSSISLTGRGPGYVNIMAFDKSGKSADPTKQSVRIYFSVQLVIDQVDNFDAFTEDKMNISPTQLGQNIAKGVMKATGKMAKDPTVKETVEAFISAIRSPYTRNITFQWGNMRYSGELNQVSAQYVMFNRKGQPVRANIDLGLQCFHEDPYPNSLGPWEDAYRRAFEKEETRAVGAAQMAGSILNLG